MEVIVITLLLLLPCITTGRGNCSSYCSYDGEYQKGFACLDEPNIYCCGNLNLRYCCQDRDGDVSQDYEPVTRCQYDESSTLRILLGVMGSVILLFLLCACTWQVCALVCSKDPQNRRVDHYDDDLPSISSTVDLRREDTRSQVFNPSAPYAFIPPPYKKDPPKYEELFGVTGQGSSNNDAFDANSNTSPSGSTALVTDDTLSANDGHESESSWDEESVFSTTHAEVRSTPISSTSSSSATEDQISVHRQSSTESSSDSSSQSEDNISISSHVSSGISSIINSNTGTDATGFDTVSHETRNAADCRRTDTPSHDNNLHTSSLTNCDI